MEMVDMLGLGSSSFLKSKGSNPFFGKENVIITVVVIKYISVVC